MRTFCPLLVEATDLVCCQVSKQFMSCFSLVCAPITTLIRSGRVAAKDAASPSGNETSARHTWVGSGVVAPLDKSRRRVVHKHDKSSY